MNYNKVNYIQPQITIDFLFICLDMMVIAFYLTIFVTDYFKIQISLITLI